MDTEATVTLDYGPLKIEIRDFEGDSYQKELEELLSFLQENQEILEDIGADTTVSKMDQSETEQASLQDVRGEISDEKVETESTEVNDPLSEIADKLNLPESDLVELFYVDSEQEEPPLLYDIDPDLLGDRQTDRQRSATLMLLYLWEMCYDNDGWLRSTKLKDALNMSGISTTSMSNMYQGAGDRYFRRRGRGPSASVSLTPNGRREAINRIQDLINHRNSE